MRSSFSRHGLNRAALAILVGLGVLAPACAPGEAKAKGPNILWVVWDTTRADRMSLYGHERETTPFLEEWTAKNARVFENCISTASSTVPSHAGMFTGKLPSEHGSRFGHQWLDDAHRTAAELLSDAGYRTFLWAANPHISSHENFQQGFDVERHPWDDETIQSAFRIVLGKVKGDKSSELARKLRSGKGTPWMIKAAGELAEPTLQEWLKESDSEQPFFAFLNYMEAHRPFVPPQEFRERFMTPEEIQRSYEVDRSWTPMWSYTFGLHEYTDEELAIMAATYDATLAELDALFKSLISSLEASGHLEDTVIILTGDHGEHLGEHHMLDHQYSLYNGLIRVPMIVSYPGRVEVGRDERPVANYDVFPTLLELADIAPPGDFDSSAVSLMSPVADRARLAELPAIFTEPFPPVRKAHPDFDPTPWERRLRAFHKGDYKLIWAENGEHELYNEALDPGEESNLFEAEPLVAKRMLDDLHEFARKLQAAAVTGDSDHQRDPAYLEMLKGLGYVDDGEEDEDEKE